MIVSIGVDSIAIQRIDDLWQRSGDRFLARVFTERERDYCLGKHHPAESFAARFCAKEAIMKCLGTGWSLGIAFHQIEVVRDERGAVGVQLHGFAAELAQQRGIQRIHLSLTHTGEQATAFAIAER